MSNKHVVVSYAGPQSFLVSDSWKQIHTGLFSQLPLRNLHWKPAFKSSIRTIQELEIDLVALETVQDDHTSQVPMTLLEKPLLNIFVVACEDIDIDTYRNSLKKQMKDWHSIMASRKHQEWLILHIVRPDARTPSGNFFQLKGSVLDKIKSDFNIDKRDRCVQLAWSMVNDSPIAWAEPINKLKDGILLAFDSAVAQREEEVRRSESQRHMPGWNFCTFFILKESLSASFEGMNLLEDAFSQYTELEAAFQQVLKEKNLSWFGTLISPGPKDDSMPLLSVTTKPYRDLILANTISVFDFRIYLVARQCALLAKLARLDEISKKVTTFLSAFGKRLEESESSVPDLFVQSWIYSSSLSVVTQCETWAQKLVLGPTALVAFHSGMGELFELARNQLDHIGVRAGHLPAKPPFSMGVALHPSHPLVVAGISNSDLLSAIEDPELFYNRYIEITNRAIDSYVKSGRRKFALKLHGSLAALDLHRGRLQTAFTTYNSLPAHYAPHLWTSLESYMQSQALDIHSSLNKSQDREWIHLVLAFLKGYVDRSGIDLLMSAEDTTERISRLVSSLKFASNQLTADLIHSDHPAIALQVPNNARIAGNNDGALLDVSLNNRLPCPFPVDEVAVTLIGKNGERYRFTIRSQCLPSGRSDVTLFCPTSSFGTMLTVSSEVRTSRLLLQWPHQVPSKFNQLTYAGHNQPILVHIPLDYQAFSVDISQPRQIQLGKPPSVCISIYSGRNDITKATLSLSASPHVNFHCLDAVTCEDNPCRIQCLEGSIILTEIPKDHTVTLVVPHTTATASESMKVTIQAEYVTLSEPLVLRTIQTRRSLSVALPLSISVQDFFRGTRLFSKFSVCSSDNQTVCISSVRLQSGSNNGLNIISCSSKTLGSLIVTPSQPANFLFCLEATNEPISEALNLLIKYRLLCEDVASLVKYAVKSTLVNSPSSLGHHHLLIHRLLETLAADSSWMEKYCTTGELCLPTVIEQESLGEPLHQVKKMLAEQCTAHCLGEWNELSIQVDVPIVNIIAAVDFTLPTDSKTRHRLPLYAGQPVSVSLVINTSVHWGPVRTDEYAMQFDVEEMVRDWLVCGQKRGDFVARHNSSFVVPLTLIALRHGELKIPKVMVRAVPSLRDSGISSSLPSTETYQVHGADSVLVLPRGGRSTFVLDIGTNSPSDSTI